MKQASLTFFSVQLGVFLDCAAGVGGSPIATSPEQATASCARIRQTLTTLLGGVGSRRLRWDCIRDCEWPNSLLFCCLAALTHHLRADASRRHPCRHCSLDLLVSWDPTLLLISCRIIACLSTAIVPFQLGSGSSQARCGVRRPLRPFVSESATSGESLCWPANYFRTVVLQSKADKSADSWIHLDNRWCKCRRGQNWSPNILIPQ